MEYVDFDLKRPYKSEPAEGPVFWLVHPCYRSWCNPDEWREVVDFAANYSGTLMVTQNELGIPRELNFSGSVDRLKDDDRIHFGWWDVLSVIWYNHLPKLKEKDHLVFGQMVDDCEMDLVKNLIRFIPPFKIHVLRRYSFSRNSEQSVEDAIQFYLQNKINIFNGKSSELEKYLMEKYEKN